MESAKSFVTGCRSHPIPAYVSVITVTAELTTMRNVTLDPQDMKRLEWAKRVLEHPGFAVRAANLIGRPIERGFSMLPANWNRTVQFAVHKALQRSLDLAVNTLWSGRLKKPSFDRMHQVAVGFSGGMGGAVGLVSLPLELPFSTTLIMRSIADIARSEGHDIKDPQVLMSCLEVFALGGRAKEDDAAENAYWAVRAMLAKAVSEAASYVSRQGAIKHSAPAMVRLISLVGSRFGIVVSEQVAAKAVPVVGAATGAAINVAFMHHFQRMARGHFIVRQLEEQYGQGIVREVYNSITESVK